MEGFEIMKRFEFDSYATLRRVRAEIEGRKRKSACEASPLPFPPFSPFPVETEGAETGRNGKNGTPADQSENITDAEEHFEERAAIHEYYGGQDRSEAEAAALIEAVRAAGIEVAYRRTTIAARR
ncbi:hypothetical protein [Ruegeria arenilitoris]|uniref:hypothetical protein n=1 Tax=Ruegeria arenilitoris TaxID=1173585 RepID=UPI00147B4F4D|nr:hypothetical protein [Ruegeria arenilitoris]